ncbi:MAG: magnesium protoporphyrin IX methyltransferase [Pseudomonadota bacterium]
MSASYHHKRSQLETYFDRTAAEGWARLTSDAPVSRIRATVRAGREGMRAALLDRLPGDLTGRRVLDAGCGFGPLSVELAKRGARVLGVDLSPTTVEAARSRLPAALADQVEFRAGDMLDPAHGRFDHVVAMDSLIHYRPRDAAHALATFAARTERSILFTVAPRTVLLTAMLAAGTVFPRRDRSPNIQPVTPRALSGAMEGLAPLEGWGLTPGARIKSGFYFSQAMEVSRA